MKEYKNDILPSTIRHPDTFRKHQPAGFDGAFDWSWTAGCFGNTKIEPMDFDGVVERKGNFIVFETKNVGKAIPQGQMMTLNELWHRGGVTLLFVYGKMKFEKATYILAKKKLRREQVSGKITDLDSARKFVKDWYEYADRHPFKPLQEEIIIKVVKYNWARKGEQGKLFK